MTETIEELLTQHSKGCYGVALSDDGRWQADAAKRDNVERAIIERDRQQRERIAELEGILTDATVEASDSLDEEPFRSWLQARLYRDHPEYKIALAMIAAITISDMRIAELEETVAAVDRELGEFSVPAYLDRGVNVLKGQYEHALKHIAELEAACEHAKEAIEAIRQLQVHTDPESGTITLLPYYARKLMTVSFEALGIVDAAIAKAKGNEG